MIAPNMIQNMKLIDGKYCSVPGWESTCAALGYKVNVKYGSTVQLSFMRQSKYPTNGNVKTLRIWPGGKVGGYPNTYIGTPDGDWWMLYTEKLTIKEGRRNAKWIYSSGIPRLEVYSIKYPSGPGKADGKFLAHIYGEDDICNVFNWQCENATNKGLPNFICIQDDPSNQVFPKGSYTKIWDVKIKVTNV